MACDRDGLRQVPVSSEDRGNIGLEARRYLEFYGTDRPLRARRSREHVVAHVAVTRKFPLGIVALRRAGVELVESPEQ